LTRALATPANGAKPQHDLDVEVDEKDPANQDGSGQEPNREHALEVLADGWYHLLCDEG